ncbi:NMD3 family-domain-containing protein [Cerioporus squamosus]|nr:NMD3 family-domain-containing protein [Cerioporus squamosus]
MSLCPHPRYIGTCADCGTPIVPNSANLCVACLRNTVDITEEYQNKLHLVLPQLRTLSVSPASWMIAQPRVSGTPRALSQEAQRSQQGAPHRGALHLDRAAFKTPPSLPHDPEGGPNGDDPREVFEIEYLVQHGQCPDCAKLAAKNTWKRLLQVRQKVPHKRTFLFLEQLILKHGAQKDTISVKEKMVEFLTGVVPVRSKASEQLLSADTHTNTANFKYTYSVEITPICKDDLVCIPPKLARQMSGISPLTITAPVYWRTPFESLASVTDLREFTVLDVEPSGQTRGKWVLADAQVALSGAFRSHGAGGDEDGMDFESMGGAQIFHTLPAHRVPDIVLVKKAYPNRRKKNKPRAWKLRSMAKEAGEEGETGPGAEWWAGWAGATRRRWRRTTKSSCGAGGG